MSAPSKSATSPSPCACTNISLMQLFHELKQKFPGVPDHVVSNTIELYCHDKQACETHLHSEVKASLTHAYHASSSAAARQLNELKLNPPSKCRNQPIIKHENVKSTPIKSVICQEPQTAIISTNIDGDDAKINTDANQNIVETNSEEDLKRNNNTSPVTIINIDSCFAKYSVESPSDLELTNENSKDVKVVADSPPCEKGNQEQPESTNYKLFRSNKIRSNLNERVEKVKEKKTIKKEELPKPQESVQTQQVAQSEQKLDPKPEQQEKIKRPNTLNFIKPNPDIAFKQTVKDTEADVNQTVSPAPTLKQENQSNNNCKPGTLYRSERVYPLNLSVNVNCHMDLSRSYNDPWLEDYESPRAITSVNLTVCTPTSNMASPVRESRENEEGFEGHVTVTVSPSTTRPIHRRAPPPPPHISRTDTPRPARTAPEPPGSVQDRSLIERQKQRLECLVKALAQEKGHLAQLTRETQILAAPLPPPSETQKLREYVEKLRDQCDSMAKKLEMPRNMRDDRESGNFYSNIYTGQQPSASWQCHLCTFRNHPLLNKCEQCEMPRILVRAPEGITVRLMPGRRKIVRSWVL